MSIETKQIIKYVLIYIIVILTRFLFYFRGIFVNPIVSNKNNGYYDYYIYPFEIQCLMYIPVFFAISLLYVVIKKEYLLETYVLFCIIKITLYIFMFFCFIGGSVINFIYGLGMLFYTKHLMKHIQTKYQMVTLTNKLAKHNFVIVILCLIAIVMINVLYIIAPKNKMIVYKEINMPHEVVIETENIDIDADIKLSIGEQGLRTNATGWVIEAKESGEGVIVLTDEGKRQSYHYKEINITVDSDLRFHFDMDMEYVILFYPLNLLLIVYCMIYIVLLPICKIGTLINNSTKNRNEVLQDAK